MSKQQEAREREISPLLSLSLSLSIVFSLLLPILAKSTAENKLAVLISISPAREGSAHRSQEQSARAKKERKKGNHRMLLSLPFFLSASINIGLPNILLPLFSFASSSLHSLPKSNAPISSS